MELDPLRCTVRVPDGVLLDLGATAKALAADRAAVRIADTTDCGVLVNLGGDIRVAGPPPADGWCIGIADDLEPDDLAPGDLAPGDLAPDDLAPDDLAPDDLAPDDPTQAALAQAVVITSGGLATSNTAVRSWRRGTAKFHHIVVPATGLPARTCWRTASVAAASCVAANTASTAAIIRGERAAGWLTAAGLPARLVRHDGTVVTVAGWPAADAPGRRA